jgi:Arc/MetJ-type ribon-helix-helix transcriptional regulator
VCRRSLSRAEGPPPRPPTDAAGGRSVRQEGIHPALPGDSPHPVGIGELHDATEGIADGVPGEAAPDPGAQVEGCAVRSRLGLPAPHRRHEEENKTRRNQPFTVGFHGGPSSPARPLQVKGGKGATDGTDGTDGADGCRARSRRRGPRAFSSASEYLRSLIREDRKREADAKLKAVLLGGLKGKTVKMTPGDWKEIRNEVRRRLRAKREK